MTAVDWILIVAAAAVALPGAILLGECLASLLPAADRGRAAAQVLIDRGRPRMAILVPAHNEQGGVAATVVGLLPQVASGDRLIVIADNCTDGTAAAAIAAGASVIERRDPERRGKGYAIQFGLEHLDADPPEVVVLVDADCRVSAGGIATIAARAAATGRPVQAEYLLGAPERPTAKGVISALAVLVRNRVRPRGLHRLGLPCHLTGSGMAFPWRVLRDAPETGSNLVEDLVMGIEMALRKHPPLLCPQASVESELPDADDAAMKQRRRWEHGQLQTLVKYGPRLVLGGLLRARPDLVGLGLDLVVPPLALLIMLQLAAVAGLVGVAALGWASWLPAVVAGGGLAAVALAVLLGWAKFARHTLPFRYLLHVPFYVLWKIPLYLSLLLGRKQKTWERTARKQD
jgi:cellulose synthase/poly-beta-1,6-N-acetylglucosamine synthase-like glycosyltransferase